jgi:site-specific DNA-cytosine methylase
MMKLIAYENHPADSRVKEMGETCTTVTSRWGTGGGNVPLVQAFDSYNLSLSDVNQTIKSPSGRTLESVGGIVQQAFRKSRRAQSVDDFETWVDDGLANTLNTFDLGDIRTTHAVAYSIREDAKANTFSATELDVANSIGALQPSPQSHHAQVFVAQPIVLEDQGGSVINTSQTGIVGTLRRESHGHEPSIVAGFLPTQGSKAQGIGWAEEQAPTLRAGCDSYGLHSNMAVRRLTPKECERLQGFPDGYTDIRPKGKDTPDGSRYKALGNSWAVPVVAWIGKRINHAIT